MKSVGGIALGLGLLLIATLSVWVIVRAARRHADRRGGFGSYARRLSPNDGDDKTAKETENKTKRAAPSADINLARETDIEAVVSALIREHGAPAVIEAARRAISKLDDSKSSERLVWQQVLETVQRLER